MGDIAGQRRGLSKRGAVFAVIVTLVAIVGGIGWYAIQAPNVPITELELAGTSERAEQVIGDLRADFVNAVHADWVLIFGYLVALVVATWLGCRVFWTPKARRVASVALIASAVAVGADVIENVLLYAALDRPTGGVWAWVQGVAFIKFSLLAVAIPVAVLGWAVTVGRLASSRLASDRRDRGDIAEADLSAEDVLPPPPLEPSRDQPLTEDPPRNTNPVTARWDTASKLPAGRDPARVGICVSGGGIRSACVTLGALQSLRDKGELRRADYLMSVSGGGYMAGAFQLALQPRPRKGQTPAVATPRRADLPPTNGQVGDRSAARAATNPISGSTADQPSAEASGWIDDPNGARPDNVLAPGSAEEDHVRRHSRYIADSSREWAAALGVLLRGATVSLALITLTVMAAGLMLSTFYRWVPIVDLGALEPRFAPRRPGPTFPDTPPSVLIAIGVIALLALVVYLVALVAPAVLGARTRFKWLQRVIDALRQNAKTWIPWLLRVSGALAGLAIVLALLGVGIPALVWVSAQVIGWLANIGGPVSTPAGSGAVAVLLAYVGTLVGILWRNRQVIGAKTGKLRALLSGTGTGGTASAVPKAVLQQLIMWLIFGVLLAALLLMLGWVVGSARTWPSWIPVLILSIFAVAVLGLDQTWLGLHPFYRRRLATAFAVRRATDSDGRVVAAPYDFDLERTTLSTYAKRVCDPITDFPRVIFAAAANLSGSDRTPPGRRAVSFTLAGDWVGGPDVGWVRTSTLERQARGELRRDLTVQAAVAISGAAFASAMGRQARAYQTFFALSNARLGAWLPNPAFLDLLRREGSDWRLPRLPRLRRLTYLLREIVGSFAVDDRLLFCTDGGHYENLGLVELLRHRCRLVYCIDATGDSPPFAGTLADAITLAYEELGVEIALDAPRDLVPGGAKALDPADPLATLNARLSKSGVVIGRITYPKPIKYSGLPQPTKHGALVIAKAALPADLPYELLSYAVSHPVFPRDTTSDQWFDHGQFDAYHTLGRYLGARAAHAGPQAEAALTKPRAAESGRRSRM